MSRHRVLGLLVVAGIVAVWALAGCGGGSSSSPVQPPPVGPAAVAGRVVQANQVGTGIGLALISAPSVGVSTTADANGQFKLTGLPTTPVTLVVSSPAVAGYGDTHVPSVPTSTAASPSPITVALLPVTGDTPISVAISPQNPSLDLYAEQQFAAIIVGTAGVISASPTWILSSPIGAIDASGHFVATAVGSATLTAVASPISASTTVTVHALTQPTITSVILSATTLTASGGNVVITAAANYGGGINSMTVEVITPKGIKATVPMVLSAGDSRDGTYSASYTAPANDNVPDRMGLQAPQSYDVRVVAAYGSPTKIVQSPFTRFTVQGLDNPIVPPS